MNKNPKVVYIAGPFRGPDHFAIHRNIVEAEALAWRVWAKLSKWRLGSCALCPHLNTAHFQNSLPDNVWLEGDLVLISRCDAVVLVEGWEKSSGTMVEYKYAKEHDIPVMAEEELDEWMAKCDATESA
jgi:hypothetical protein